jgi:eukaryotic-like serine/threonine-protein kinase
MNYSIGETIGDYRVLQELGGGGMGRVFKVEHTVTQRLEAMKVLEGGRPGAQEQAARSLREIQIQASLGHPNIAAVHNAFWAGENLVLVMELIDGRSLRSVLETQRLPLATALNYACQALSALKCAHAHGVIHRDISPANMMISPSGVLKVTDFGLAKGPADVRVSLSGAPLGSLYYMSPEQVRGAEAGVRSDLYSLGVVLYELTTGKRPFDGRSAFSIMAGHIDKPPAPPIEVEPSLPHLLNRAILRSLEKDPAQRFGSADEFLQVLTRVRSAGAGSQPALSAALSRSRVIWAAASVAVVSLALGGLFLSREWHWPGKQPPAVVGHRPDTFVHESETSVQAPPDPIAATPSGARTIHSQAPSVTKRSPNEPAAKALVAREPESKTAPDSPDSGAQAPREALSPATPAPGKEDGVATSKRGRNPVMKALSKIWHLGRHKKYTSEDGVQSVGP